MAHAIRENFTALSKMPPGELPPSATLEIALEGMSFAFRSKRNRGFDAPRPILYAVWACATIMFSQAFAQVSRTTRVMDGRICFADEDVDVKESVPRGLACQAVVFGAHGNIYRYRPAFTLLRRGSLRFWRERAKAKAGPTRIRTWDQGIMSPLL